MSEIFIEELWRRTLPHDSLKKVLVSGARLPLVFWKERFFFKGAMNSFLHGITDGQFSFAESRGSHPVFAVKRLENMAGMRVCPCSSRKPGLNQYRYISKGCELLHTRHVMDRTSFLVEELVFNMPSDKAKRLRFFGEVPKNCIRSAS